ncbi:MAG: hypothetical protein WD738_16445 [Pirellulales bacterium]
MAVQLPLCREELMAMMQDSLESFAAEMGLRIAAKLLEEEVLRRCGPRYRHSADRQLTRYGRQRGVVTLAGQKLPIERPRVRRTDGQGEVELETYDLLQRDEAMPEACLRRMVRGVSTRDYESVIDLATEGFGVKRSSVSRSFVTGCFNHSCPCWQVIPSATSDAKSNFSRPRTRYPGSGCAGANSLDQA